MSSYSLLLLLLPLQGHGRECHTQARGQCPSGGVLACSDEAEPDLWRILAPSCRLEMRLLRNTGAAQQHTPRLWGGNEGRGRECVGEGYCPARDPACDFSRVYTHTHKSI